MVKELDQKAKKQLEILIGDDEIVGVIKSSTNYDLFGTGETKLKKIDGNRDVDSNHVEKLVASFKEEYLISPILVNGKHEMIDGQHRFEAAKICGEPIFYIVEDNYGAREMQLFNANMSVWTINDFIRSYAKEGLEEFKEYVDFCKHFPSFTKRTCEAILTKAGDPQNTNSNVQIKNGVFVIPNIDKSYDIANHVMDFQGLFPYWSTHAFAMALMYVWQHPKYDPVQMLDKVKKNIDEFYEYRDKDSFIDLLNKTYNKHGKKEEIDLKKY